MLSGSGLRLCRLRLLCRVLAISVAIALPAGAAFGAQSAIDASATPRPAAEEPSVPAEFGQIVFQINGHAPRQIFIIGQSHRSALTGRTSPDIVRAQAEVYRIGEWLIRERKVGLLLPEGFFQRDTNRVSSPVNALRDGLRLDNRTLEAELSNARRFVNADLLLNACYNIHLAQVEDERLYREISRLLAEARREGSLPTLAELDCRQGERTAALLQNIPEVVEEAFRTGRIDTRKAIFTIGLAHVGEIIRLLERGSLLPPAVKPGLTAEETAGTTLNLLHQGYGVTVIIPRALAGKEQVLRLTRLEAD